MVANRNAAHLAEAADREINELVTVEVTNNSGLGVSEDYFVEAIRHRRGRDKVYWVGFDLSPADAFGGFWIMGTSELGVTTRLA